MVAAIGRACGKPEMRATAFPWAAIMLASPLVTLFREMLEMRYLWREPLRMDNSRLIAFLGEEPHTPLDEAIRAALRGLGCLPNGDAEPAAEARWPSQRPGLPSARARNASTSMSVSQRHGRHRMEGAPSGS